MFKGILHLHITAVVIFLIIYAIKNFLLLSNKTASLDNFIKKTKIVEMVISFLFLATGIYLWANSGMAGPWLYVKVAAVLVSIPLAIIGFKKRNKVLALLSFILLIYAYGVAETKSPVFKKTAPSETEQDVIMNKADMGKKVYQSYCISCHGEDGKLGESGSTDLSTSTLSMTDRVDFIKQGKSSMPAFSGMISEKEIESVALYIESLRTK